MTKVCQECSSLAIPSVYTVMSSICYARLGNSKDSIGPAKGLMVDILGHAWRKAVVLVFRMMVFRGSDCKVDLQNHRSECEQILGLVLQRLQLQERPFCGLTLQISSAPSSSCAVIVMRRYTQRPQPRYAYLPDPASPHQRQLAPVDGPASIS